MEMFGIVSFLALVGSSAEEPYAASRWDTQESDEELLRFHVESARTIDFAGDSHHRNFHRILARSRRDAREISRESDISHCFYTFSAAAKLRRELFFFKGKNFWRLNETSEGKFNGMPMSSFWRNYNGGDIDAVFERPDDQYMVFISGDKYWVYSDPENIVKRAASIEDFGLRGIHRIDAAVVWEQNKRVYLFSGDKYWKLDKKMTPVIGYPKNISELSGVPTGLDAAVEDHQGKIYLLKGHRCWYLDDDLLAVDKNYSDFVGSKWFGCNRTLYNREAVTQPYTTGKSQSGTGGAPMCQHLSITLCTLVAIFWKLISFLQK